MYMSVRPHMSGVACRLLLIAQFHKILLTPSFDTGFVMSTPHVWGKKIHPFAFSVSHNVGSCGEMGLLCVFKDPDLSMIISHVYNYVFMGWKLHNLKRLLMFLCKCFFKGMRQRERVPAKLLQTLLCLCLRGRFGKCDKFQYILCFHFSVWGCPLCNVQVGLGALLQILSLKDCVQDGF